MNNKKKKHQKTTTRQNLPRCGLIADNLFAYVILEKKIVKTLHATYVDCNTVLLPVLNARLKQKTETGVTCNH